MTHPSPYELRVLDGPQKGARLPLEADRALVLGRRWDSDVVLRSEGAGDRSLSLVSEGGRFTLRVLQGDARVGAQEVQVNQSTDLALYTPVQLGDVRLAVGETGEMSESQWAELWQSTTASGAAGPDAQGPAGLPADPTQLARPARGLLALRQWMHEQRWPPRLLLTLGGGLAAMSVSALTFAFVVERGPLTPQESAQQTQSSLSAAGFDGLAVRAEPDGSLAVSGYVDNNAARAQVDRILSGAPAPVRWKAWNNDQVVASVREVYRVNGVRAEVEVAGPGQVRVTTREADEHKLAGLAAAAKRDVVGLQSLQGVNHAPEKAPDNTHPVISDPGKRIASVVPGDVPYLVTADGTRYFQGALLPTGHRIASIEAQRVMLDQNGKLVALQF